MGSKIKVIPVSLNVNGLHDKVKQKRLWYALCNLKPDIVLLQETHLTHDRDKIIADRAFPYKYHSKGSSKARGTAILLHKSLQFTELAVKKDKKGRFLAIKGLLNGELVTIVSLYAPNTAQISFIKDIFQNILEFGDSIIIAMGDLNYISDLKLDRS